MIMTTTITHDGSMYGIYIYIHANIWGILMGSMLSYIPYMDPMATGIFTVFKKTHWISLDDGKKKKITKSYPLVN